MCGRRFTLTFVFMEKSFILRRALQVMLPATLLLASCGKKDEPAAAAPDKGRVLITHAAAAANTQITAFVADGQVAQLNYGQSSTYQTVNAGAPTLRINNGTQVVASQALTVGKDQNYSVFVYSPAATIGSAALLTAPDDLTAPPTGQFKVRFVHLGVGAASPLRLTVASAVPSAPGTDITPDIPFGTTSGFVNLTAGTVNLNITSGGTPRTQVMAVGDGAGAGTGTKNYENGKIYTILLRGIEGTGVPTAQQKQTVIIQNN